MTERNEIPGDGEAAESGPAPWWRRMLARRSWEDVAPFAHVIAFVAWLGVILLVAVARVRPWNEWSSWRRWLRADRRGWEMLIPGLLLGLSALAVVRAHTLWERGDGWSPRVVGLMLVGTAAGAGGVLWGLYTLGLRPFAVV